MTARLNNALRRLGSGWAIFVEAQRVAAQTYPPQPFPGWRVGAGDLERQDAFEEVGAHFESRYFLTFVWLPPAEDASRIGRLALRGPRAHRLDPGNCCAASSIAPTACCNWSRASCPRSRADDSETLTYLHSTISHPAAAGARPRDADAPRRAARRRAAHRRSGAAAGAGIISARSPWSVSTATHPGILDELNRLAFPYRWSTRAILLDKTEAVKAADQDPPSMVRQAEDIAAIVKEVMTNEASTLVDFDAANKAPTPISPCRNWAPTMSARPMSPRPSRLGTRTPARRREARLVEKVIQGRDFTCMPEGVNAIEAWLGSHPGTRLRECPSAAALAR